MVSSQTNTRRRFVVGTGAAWLGFVGAAQAAKLTGIPPLDTPALQAKSPAGVFLIAITCTPGNRLVAVGEHGMIIHSDDNGLNWTQASVPVNVTLTCVSFVTKQLGWAAGHSGVILNTQDGGDSWQEQLNGVQANQLTLQAANAATASDPSPGAPHAQARAQHFVADGPDKPFLTMLVLSPQKLLAFGAYRLTMLSTDGGNTWQDWSLHIYDPFSHNIYASAAIGGALYLAVEEGLMFCSTDGGNSFLPLTTPGSSTLFGVLGPKDGSLLVFGVAGFAARSTDKGKTWSVLEIATQEDLTGGRVLASGAVVMVDEAGLVLESHDNGVTFSRVSGIQPAPFFDLEQAPDGELIAVGAAGVTRIAKSLLAS